MPQRRSHVALSAAQSELAVSLAELREELDAPVEFSSEAEAEAAAASAPGPEIDLREIPFVTLDPVGARDLDQAFHLERTAAGYTVRYAIADVPGLVRPGGAVDAEARLRGQTLYLADGSIPLHPPALSENLGSLLPDQDRSALVWTFELDREGRLSRFDLRRATVRSRAQLDYVSVQAQLDAGEDSPAALLPEIGRLRMALEAERGGASLNMPDEEVVREEDGSYSIVRSSPLPVEEWNAQLSLMTGMAAAELMLAAKVGILRTMPAPDDAAFAAFRRQTKALGRPWTDGDYGTFLRDLDREDPLTLPVLEAAASLFRGAGYVAFDGAEPSERMQAAIAAPYAHATAPLRRLVDRWSLAICLAISHGEEPPAWARESLAELPALMQQSGQRASQANASTVNRVEAALLAPLVGSTLEAAIIEVREGGERATVQIADPAVTVSAPLPADARPGDTVTVQLVRADIHAGQVEFTLP